MFFFVFHLKGVKYELYFCIFYNGDSKKENEQRFILKYVTYKGKKEKDQSEMECFKVVIRKSIK